MLVQTSQVFAKMVTYSYLLLYYCPSSKVSSLNYNLIKNSQAVKKGVAPKKAMVKKDVKSKVAAKKWL